MPFASISVSISNSLNFLRIKQATWSKSSLGVAIGYTDKIFFISDVIKNRDCDLFNRITSYSDTRHVLYDLHSPKHIRNRALRDRGHDFILPRVKSF